MDPQAILDLDLQEILVQLAINTNQSLVTAKTIYEKGLYAKTVAQVTLAEALIFPITATAQVIGKAESGAQVLGTVLEDYRAGSQFIKIEYTVQSSVAQLDEDDSIKCRVGGNLEATTEGCKFVAARVSRLVPPTWFPYILEILTLRVRVCVFGPTFFHLFYLLSVPWKT